MRVFTTAKGEGVGQIGHEGSGAHTYKDSIGIRIYDLGGDSVTLETMDAVADIIERHGAMHYIMNRDRIDSVALETLLKQPVIGDLILLQFADSLGCGLPKEKRLAFVRAEYIEGEMRKSGLHSSASENTQLQRIFSWIREETQRIKTLNEDKLGYENWSPAAAAERN